MYVSRQARNGQRLIHCSQWGREGYGYNAAHPASCINSRQSSLPPPPLFPKKKDKEKKKFHAGCNLRVHVF